MKGDIYVEGREGGGMFFATKELDNPGCYRATTFSHKPARVGLTADKRRLLCSWQLTLLKFVCNLIYKIKSRKHCTS